ncbi:glycosyltransferase family 2 protein [Cephaloticoccus capnophilus]|uniref:glycosyltransferase family 2 protein n=1 Tax=Cephaloticoccus capnophilus TaxID=1548208 RepID=UPI0008386E6E|nr:glycosyltransferase family 2 protein [Cephaloticoccus capnophilus]
MISAIILTLNEEKKLPTCLASLRECDDIVLLDSGSTDRTIEIARAHGARIFANPFQNFAQQRNYAHEHIPFRHPWLIHLDADETMTPELWAECCAIAARDAQSPLPLDGYYVAPKMFFQNRWIPHCTDYPSYQARLVHVQRFRFIEVGHGQREASGLRLGTIHANYLHDLSASGEVDWLAKHRRYAAAEVAAYLSPDTPPFRFADLFSRKKITRRRALKRLAFHLPLRPQLRFFYQYFLRGGFLDGPPGLRYCGLLMHYERFILDALCEARAEQRKG